jgi:putative lipoic acid-binding regulatory protein
MTEYDPIELLESCHPFPGTFQIKAIGEAEDGFEGRVIAIVREELPAPSDLDHSVRMAKGGRHIALTLDVTVQSAKQVLAIYARLRDVRGLKLLL